MMDESANRAPNPAPAAPTTPGDADAYSLAKEDGGCSWIDHESRDSDGGNGNTGDNTGNNWFQSLSGRIVTHPHFEPFILALIGVNASLMGISTCDAVTDNPTAHRAFEAAELAFLVVFTVELILDFGYRGVRGLFRSSWLTFDFVVIGLSWAYPALQIVRAFRCLRLLSRIDSVKKLLCALHSVLPVVGSIVLLLSVIFYVFDIIFTDLFKEMYRDGLTGEDYFSRLDRTLFTLFQVMTGAGWPDIAREVMDTYGWAWMPFVSFIVVTMFVAIELAVAAVCKSVSKMEELGIIETGGGGGGLRDSVIPNGFTRLERKLDILTDETAVGGRNGRVAQLNASAPPALDATASSGARRPLYDRLSLRFGGSVQSMCSAGSFQGAEVHQRHNCLPHWLQSFCGAAVNSVYFHNAIVVLIVLNSVTMGIATFDFVTENSKMLKIFDAIDLLFLVIFTAELAFQFGYHGMNFFKSGWLTFDFLVIGLSWAYPTLQVARAFRCFRLFSRLYFMRDIIEALLSVIPNLGTISMLLLLMFYIFGVLFTDMFKRMYEDGLTSEDFFSSLDRTLFTLFQCMTIAGWPDIAREVMKTYSWAWLPFITWIIISKFTMVQLIIAVLCQSLGHISTEEETDDTSDDDDEVARLERKLELLANNIDAMLASGRLSTPA